MQERRPCEGDHTQHPSGTAEQDTLRTWSFSLRNCLNGKKTMERQGGKVRKLVGVSKKLFQSAEKNGAQRVGCKVKLQ